MVHVSTQAQIAIYSLQPQDQERVKRLIAQLENFPQDAAMRQQASQLHGFSDTYLLRATPSLRLIFKYAGGRGEVVDVVTHDRLRHMAGYAA